LFMACLHRGGTIRTNHERNVNRRADESRCHADEPGPTRQLIADPQAASRLFAMGSAARALARLADKLDNAPLVTSSNCERL
jgi:hypothetical protein